MYRGVCHWVKEAVANLYSDLRIENRIIYDGDYICQNYSYGNKFNETGDRGF